MSDYIKGMKDKTIKKVLKQKLEEWLITIDDIDVQEQARKNVIVTGGSIASLLLGEKVNDYDIYFQTKQTTQAVAEYYVNKWNDTKKTDPAPFVEIKDIENLKGETESRVGIFVQSAGVVGEADPEEGYDYYEGDTDGDRAEEYIESITEQADDGEKYRPVFMSQNAISLSDKLQIVIRFYGKPEEIHDNYDFVHATSWYRLKDNKLETPPEALRSLMSRTLIYRGSLYPVCSLFRLRKFIQRGWSITAGQVLKIANQVSTIDMTDVEVLREQLTGVDAAYMHELIQIISKAKDEGKTVDHTYIATVIDRLFD